MKIKQRIGQLSENTRIVLKNSMGAFIIRGGSLVVSLLTMPVFIRFFDNQALLGVWFTLLSIINWVLNFDMGISNGLRNKLTVAIATDNRHDLRRYISSAYLILGLVTLLLGVAGYALLSYIPWNDVLNVAPSVVSEDVMMLAVRNIFLGIMLQFFLRTISSVLYALQYSAINNLILLAISLLQLLFALLFPRRGSAQENLILMSHAYILLANIPFIVATVLVFALKLRHAIPSPRYFSASHSRDVLSLGGIFFLCQILFMLIMNTNEFFISRYTGPESVVEYQIYNRLFSFVGTLFSLVLTPLWSSITKAVAEKDRLWISRLFTQLERVIMVAAVFEFLLIPVAQPIVDLWLGAGMLRVDYFHAAAFALFGAALIYTNVVSTVACGIGRMGLQVICFSLGVAAKFLVLYFLMPVYPSWILIILLNFAILLAYSVPQHIALKRVIIRI